jgi:methyl-accepting chemotaxis protein
MSEGGLERGLTVRAALAWTGLLFLIPALVLMGLVVARSWTDIADARREQRGLDYLARIWPAMTQTDLDLGPSQPAFDLEFGTSEAAADFLRATAIDNRFKAGGVLIADVADGAHLTQDPELGEDHLIEAITARLPALINAATELNEAVQINDAGQPARLAVGVDHLQATHEQAQAALAAAAKYDPSGISHSVLYPHLAGLAAATRDLAARVQAAGAGGDSSGVSAARLELQRQIDGAWRASQEELDRLIEARVFRLAERLAAELVLVLALMIVAAWITARIAAGLSGRLLDLAEVGEKLIANQVYIDVPHVAVGGEIGRVALAFAGLKSDLIERNLTRFDADDRHRAVEAQLDAAQAAIATAQSERRAAIDALGSAIRRLGRGDLTAAVDEPLAQDFQGLKTEFNAAAALLREALTGVAGEAEDIQREVEDLNRGAQELTRRHGEQTTGLEAASSTLGALAEEARGALSDARRANGVVGSARDEAEQGDAIVRQAAKSMEQIAILAQQITQIVGVMDEIAFQTNLLALNAGVEAARSGEAGRGFAVVAQEVRALAQRSAGAAKDIRALILASNREVGSGVDLVGQTSQALARILRQVADIDGAVAALAQTTERQVEGLVQAGGLVGQVDQSARRGSVIVDQSAAAARTLRQEVEDLSRWMAGLELWPPAPPPARDSPRAASRLTRPAPVIQLREVRSGQPRRADPEARFSRRSDRDGD